MSVSSDPTDPATLLRNTLAVLGMRQVDLAKRAGLSAKHVNQIAKGVVGVTPEVALKLEHVTGVPAMEWNRVNAAHQVGLLRRRPRVWWSESQGVLEELPGAVRNPVRVIRVTGNVVLDAMPGDSVELLPAELLTPQTSTVERDTDQLVHDMARAIRDAYEKDIPDPVGVTDVEDWYGEARAALAVVQGEAP